MIKKVTVSHLYFRPVPTKNHSRSRKYQPPDTSPKRGCNRLEASTMFQMNMPMITPMSRRKTGSCFTGFSTRPFLSSPGSMKAVLSAHSPGSK